MQSLEVYTPVATPIIQQARPSEWAAVVGQGIGAFTTIGGIVAGGNAAVGLAREVGKAGTAGYPYAQGAVTTNAMNYSTGTLGSGTYDATHTPTVVMQPAPVIVP